MTPEVELFSATDSITEPDRRVWYWTRFRGKDSERTEDYELALAEAKRLMAEHDAVLIDRSDKGSGFLRSTLGK